MNESKNAAAAVQPHASANGCSDYEPDRMGEAASALGARKQKSSKKKSKGRGKSWAAVAAARERCSFSPAKHLPALDKLVGVYPITWSM